MIIILFFAFLFGSIIYDGLKWRDGDYITKKGHLARFCVRGFVFALLSAFYYDESVGPHASAALIPYMWGMATTWWILFDIGVNTVAGQKVFHLGRTSFFDSVFWRIGSWMTSVFQAITKKEKPLNPYLPSIISQYTVKLSALALGLWLLSGDGFAWFMRTAHRLYFESIW